MSNTEIKYNLNYEFFSSILNLVKSKQGIRTKKNNHAEVAVINNFYHNLETNMDLIMKQDFDLVFLNFSGIFIAFYEIANECKSIEDCLFELETASTHDLLNRYLRRIHVDLTVIDNDNSLKLAIEKNPITDIKSTDAESFLLYKHNAVEIKRRYCSFLNNYYHKYFKGFVPHIKEYLSKTVKKHQEIYDIEQDRFFNELIWYKSENEFKTDKPIYLYTMYFSYAGQALWNFEDAYYHHYGFTLIERLKVQPNEKHVARLFKTLADPKRLQILKLLAKATLYSKELAEKCELTAATTSYHMKKLVEVGLVKIEWHHDNKVHYSLNKKALESKLLEAVKIIIK